MLNRQRKSLIPKSGLALIPPKMKEFSELEVDAACPNLTIGLAPLLHSYTRTPGEHLGPYGRKENTGRGWIDG